MKAVVRNRYGSADVLELQDVAGPTVGDDDVLIRVRAASVNPLDWYEMTGRPYFSRASLGLRRPKINRLGVDLAGQVEAVGANVTRFRPGDEVFGGRGGAFAEHVCIRHDRGIAHKPGNITFEQAAAVPVAGLTALQGLRDKGQLQPGQSVLINGASGGVGTFAVQIAKALGAEVTGVCSTGNVDLVRSLGADHVVDYTREDFTAGDRRYDLFFDVAGSRSWAECRRVLTPRAMLIIVGGPKANRLIGPLGHMLSVVLAAAPSRRKATFFVSSMDQADLVTLRDMLETGKISSVLDRHYDVSEIAEAFRYLGEGHARGKIVISL